tara:strand:- start:3832 stop:4524 length:693 start_codon:yes stop_codon:yes gene_type:complete
MFKEPRIKADAGALYESLLLMRAFAEQQREHIRDYSKNLEEYIEEEEIETIVAGRENNDEMVTSPARHISGVFEHDFDLKAVFTEVMPIYQNQATLIALWSKFESGLCLVAESLAAEHKKKIRDKERGISTVAHYLDEIERLGLKHRDRRHFRAEYDFLSSVVGRIRNAWVHDGGRASKRSISQIVNKESDLVMRNDVINVTDRFLARVIQSMLFFSKEIYLLSGRQRKG